MRDEIHIVREPVTWPEIKRIAIEGPFHELTKAAVDVKRRILAVGGEMHVDAESALLDDGSSQQAVWGINLHPDAEGINRVEFDSMINIRPSQGNRSRSVESAETRASILEVIQELIH